MKIKSVFLLSVAGILTSSISVYSLTPPGERSAQPDVPLGVPADSPELTDKQVELARFTTGGALLVDGRLGNARLAQGSRGETFVMLEVRGSDAASATAAPAVNLAIVMDRSGSMKGSRLQNAINAANEAVERLREGDVVSLVSFDTRTSVIVRPTAIDASSRSRIKSAISSVTLGGDTCISCGIEEGIVELEQTMGRVNRMILLSDGDANHGVRDVSGFRSMAQRARERGISVTTIGVDVDYNEKILSAIAEESNGRHYFVENDSSLSQAFQAEAESLRRTIASGAEASIDLGEGVELDRVFDRSFRKNGNRVVVPLGTFARNEVKTILLKVRVPAGVEGERAVADVRLDYKDLIASADASCSGKLGLLVSREGDDPLDPVVAGRAQRTETAAVLEEANTLFASGRADEARRRLNTAARKVDAVASNAVVAAKPSPRAPDVERDFKAQLDALNQAESAFATPPAAGAVAEPQEQSRAGKSAVKRNVERATQLGF